MSAPTPNTSSEFTIFETLSSNSYVNVLLQGTKWGGDVGERATVYYSFASSKSDALWSQDIFYGYGSEDAEYLTLSSLSGSQKKGVINALTAWANVANISFVEVKESSTAVGDIRFGFTSGGAMDASTYAYTYTLNVDSTDTPYAMSGDIWFNKTQPVSTGENFNLGYTGYLVALHEIGHALGLDHSFAETSSDDSLPNALENFQYSVMSYSDTSTTNDDGLNDYYPTTPMLYDILAIQYLYGANMTYNTGDNTYTFSATKYYYQTIWDAGGTDTIEFKSNVDGVIDLREGKFSQLGKAIGVGVNNTSLQKDNVAIAFGVEIENAIGGSKSDTITGNDLDNRLLGQSGNDSISSGSGEDAVYGGNGNDYIYGGVDADLIYGDSGNDYLDGETGADFMAGGKGRDVYIVDDELDEIQEVSSKEIDLVRTSVSYTLATNLEDMVLIEDSIAENGTGNQSNNNIVGNSIDNVLIGLAGNDTLEGLAGTDQLEGGDGNDQLDGGSGNDSLTGGGGKDTLLGDAGDDILVAGGGIDVLEGGAGNDTYYVNLTNSGTLEDVIKEVYELGSQDRLILGSISTNTKATEIKLATYFEEIDSSGTVTSLINITGNVSDNVIVGNDANNIINGGLGKDTITGGDGADSFVLNASDSLTNFDVIQDFESTVDKILLSKVAFKNLVSVKPNSQGVALSSEDFITGTGITSTYNTTNNSSYHLLFNTSTSQLYYDVDGLGSAEAVVIAGVYGDLIVSDFLVIT